MSGEKKVRAPRRAPSNPRQVAMNRHTVRQGECLSAIAAAYGFADWRKVYDDAANAELRKKRPDPHVLFPGDVIVIPDREERPVEVETGKVHRFKVKIPKRSLKVRMLDEHKTPIADEPFTAVVDDVMHYDTTDGDGVLSLDLPIDATTVEIWIAGQRRTLELGALNPIEDTPDEGVSGIQGRLRGLGFNPGPIDGKMGPRTRGALVAFQRHFGLKETGKIDDETKGRLKKEYRA
jgi:hypothetical protein